MERSKSLFKIFMPITLGLTVIGLIFGALSLILTYSQDTGNIKLGSAFSILFIVFTSLALVAPIVLSILAKDTNIITRTPKTSLLFKIASGIVIGALVALFVFDCIVLVKELNLANEHYNNLVDQGKLASDAWSEGFNRHFEFWRVARMVLSIPFIAHLVFGFLPSKIRLPMPLKTVCHSLSILWCTATPIIIYFFKGSPPTTEYFRVVYSMAFIMLTLFLLYDFKWLYLETSFRVYSAVTIIATSFSLIASISTIIAMIIRSDSLIITDASKYQSIFDIHCINIFEIFVVLALGILALSRVLLILKTVKIVANKKEN